jgi:hypothetical protein
MITEESGWYVSKWYKQEALTVNASLQQSWVRSLYPSKTMEFDEKLKTGGIGILAIKKLLNEKD